MSRTRKEVLTDLMNFNGTLEEIKEELSPFNPFDCDVFVILETHHIVNILANYLEGSIHAKVIYDWADTIEMRDDIDYEESCEDEIKEFITDMANYDINYELDKDKAREWIERLSK